MPIDHPRARASWRRVALATMVCALASARDVPAAQEPAERPDVIIIGAGVAGLSAALEAGRAGATVLVVDMSTVGGGHAILSNGAVCIVQTPLQASRGISDSPAVAEKDFLERGHDNDVRWVAAYARDSRRDLYDWLTDLGVRFDNLVKPAGNPSRGSTSPAERDGAWWNRSTARAFSRRTSDSCGR